MATENPFPSLLRRARKLGVPESYLSRVVLSAWTAPDGGIHHPEGFCSAVSSARGGNRWNPRTPLAGKDTSLSELSSLRSCDSCTRRLAQVPSSYRYHRGEVSLYVDLVWFTEDSAAAASAERFVKKGSGAAGRVVKLQEHVKGSLARVESRLGKADADLDPLLSALREQLDAAVAKLSSAAGGERQRTAVAESIREEMLPGRFRAKMTLDDSPVLLGLICSAPSRRVQEVLDAFQVGGAKGNPVLLVPRFVSEWLNRSMSTSTSWGGTMLSVPCDHDRSVAETAAAFWAPHGDGPLADLKHALAAAAAALD